MPTSLCLLGGLIRRPRETNQHPADVATWVVTMRHADSILTALRDEDIATGVESPRAMGDTTLEPLALTLITAVAP